MEKFARIRISKIRCFIGIALVTFSYVFIYSVPIFLIYNLNGYFKNVDRVLFIILILISMLLINPLYKGMKRIGQRLLVPTSNEIMLQPEVDTVLYLRCFTLEIPMEPRKKKLLYFKEFIGLFASFKHPILPDEHVAILTSSIGSFIALAHPKEKLPLPGALRIKSEDENWEEKIRALINRSKLIVIDLLDPTPGIIKEINFLVEENCPTKIIAILGKQNPTKIISKESYDLVCQKFSNYFPSGLPEYKSSPRCITFRDDWKPHLISPFEKVINTDLAILYDHNTMLLEPTGLAIDDFHLSFISALESSPISYSPPNFNSIPFDLKIIQYHKLIFNPIGEGIILAMLLLKMLFTI